MSRTGDAHADIFSHDEDRFVWDGVSYKIVEDYVLNFGDKKNTYVLCCDEERLVGLVISQGKYSSESCFISGDVDYVCRGFFDLMRNDEECFRVKEGLEIARRVRERVGGEKFLGGQNFSNV